MTRWMLAGPIPAPVVAPMLHDHPEVKAALVAAKAVGYLGLAVFVGGLTFLALLWPEGTWDREIRRILVVAWSAGTGATVAAIGLQGAYGGMEPLSATFRPGLLSTVLNDHVGEVWAVRGLLWVLAGIVLAWALRMGDLAVRTPAWRTGALAIALGLLRTTGMTGHAPDAVHSALAQVADLFHLVGVSLWIGGLVVLLLGVVRRRVPEELNAVVPRYSNLALTSVLLIASSGLVLAWQLVGSVPALVNTAYGRVLLVKLAFLACVLAAAQRSKRWVATRLDLAVVLRGDAATLRPLVLSVAAETTLLLAVVTAASLLVTAAPGR